MTTKAERKAKINEEWPRALYPGMNGLLLAELDAEFEPAGAPADASAPSPSPRKASPEPVGANEGRIKRIIEDTGVSRIEAERRVAVADGTLDIEDMSLNELRGLQAELIKGSVFDLNPERDEDAAADTRSMDELIADSARQIMGSDPGSDAEQREWAEGLQERVSGRSGRAQARYDAAYNDTKAQLRLINYPGDIEAAAKSAAVKARNTQPSVE